MSSFWIIIHSVQLWERQRLLSGLLIRPGQKTLQQFLNYPLAGRIVTFRLVDPMVSKLSQDDFCAEIVFLDGPLKGGGWVAINHVPEDDSTFNDAKGCAYMGLVSCLLIEILFFRRFTPHTNEQKGTRAKRSWCIEN